MNGNCNIELLAMILSATIFIASTSTSCIMSAYAICNLPGQHKGKTRPAKLKVEKRKRT